MHYKITNSKGHSYIQLVQSVRVNGIPTQKTIHYFGRIDRPQDKKIFEEMIIKGGDICENIIVLSELTSNKIEAPDNKIIGSVLVFEKLWKDLHIDAIINYYAKDTRFTFNPERIIFACTLQRLIKPGSDKSLVSWLENYQIEGCEDFKLHHCYRTIQWLGKPIDAQVVLEKSEIDFQKSTPEIESPNGEIETKPTKQAASKEPKLAKSIRTIKDELEEEIYFKRRNLLTQINCTFFDTTSIYFEGRGGDELGHRGHSKDHRPELNQTVVGVVLYNTVFPICTEIWKGNTDDVTTIVPVAKRLHDRFRIDDVCIVADRGMISKNTIEQIKQLGWTYILGVKMRNNTVIDDLFAEIFTDKTPYIEVVPPRHFVHDYAPLKIKDILRYDKNNELIDRHIVCFNEEEAERDRLTRQQIILKLEEALNCPNKSLIANKGYKKFIKVMKEAIHIDTEKIETEAKYDGLYILTTNSDKPAAEIALKYKELIQVEDTFREFKSDFNTRPVYHQTDSAIRGHIWISFLAFYLKKSLLKVLDKLNNYSKGKILKPGTQNFDPCNQQKLRNIANKKLTWNEVLDDLNSLSVGVIQSGNTRFQLRTAARKETLRIFKALEIRLPNILTKLDNTLGPIVSTTEASSLKEASTDKNQSEPIQAGNGQVESE